MSSSFVLRFLRLLAGLLLYGLAEGLMVHATIGVSPWMVFAQGIAAVTGLGLGVLTVLIGAAVLLLWIPLRQRPGLGTLMNVLLVGPFIELGLWLFPAPSWFGATGVWAVVVTVLYFTIGLLLLAVASGIYIGAAMGPGPRDGLMTGLHSRLGWPIWIGRTAVEGTVLAAGWLLGGNVGLGTVAFALFVGPLCGVTLRWFGVTRARGRADASSGSVTGARPDADADARPAHAVRASSSRPSRRPSRRASSPSHV
ncbi:membrane protein YczE [Herbiconiux liukaitaii]|uniref:membrane protein YczE n=1 Tax=Herbiconiux liukaitaii TaxID=3342799 RepID=UPI0035B9556C